MISISSGIKFKGTWRRGYINGMGTLHLNDKEYIARDWSRERGRTFKELIDDIIEERRVKKDNKIQAHKAHYGNTELNLIRFYVKNVRHKIYQDRKKARDKKNRDAQKFKAQCEKNDAKCSWSLSSSWRRHQRYNYTASCFFSLFSGCPLRIHRTKAYRPMYCTNED